MVRVDKVTGKVYTYNNIPADKEGKLISAQCRKGYYKIFSENHNHPEDSWYEGRFIGDRYAVFKWVNSSSEAGFYQQVSKWYNRFGNAVRKLQDIVKE